MKRTMRRGAWTLALLATHGLAMAAVDENAARELTKKSGLWSQLASIGTQVQAGLDSAAQQAHDKLEPEQRRRLASCTQGAFAAEPMRVVAVQTVAGALAAADLPALQGWYDSATGRKVSALEEAAGALTGDPRERLRLGSETLAAASAARRAALQAVLDNTASPQRMVDTMVEVTLAVQQGFHSAAPDVPGPSADELRAMLERQRPQLTARYTEILRALFASTYAGLDDAELQRYADFLHTSAGTSFNDAAMRGMVRALRGGAVQMGRCVQDARSTHGS